MEQENPRKKMKENDEEDKNLSGHPDEIYKILTNLDDPNTSELEILSSDESDCNDLDINDDDKHLVSDNEFMDFAGTFEDIFDLEAVNIEEREELQEVVNAFYGNGSLFGEEDIDESENTEENFDSEDNAMQVEQSTSREAEERELAIPSTSNCVLDQSYAAVIDVSTINYHDSVTVDNEAACDSVIDNSQNLCVTEYENEEISGTGPENQLQNQSGNHQSVEQCSSNSAKSNGKRKRNVNSKQDKPKVRRKNTTNKKSSNDRPSKTNAANNTNSKKKSKKQKMPKAKWFAKDNEYTNKVPQFQGTMMYNLSEPTKGETPLYFFSNLFPQEIYNIMTTETNAYALQKGYTLGVTVEDMKVFMALNMIMTNIKYPNYRMYWSNNTALQMDLIANAMPLKKFEKIKRFLHFIDNNTIPADNKDIFVKIRPILDMLNNCFQSCATPPEFVAVDEMIIPFKGRCKAKQYIKSKPKKWGFKAWVLAGFDGYVHKFEMYQGKSTENAVNLGVIADTVLRLCESIEGFNHKLFLDNLFPSIPLLKELAKRDIHVVGTLRTNRLSGVDTILGSNKELMEKERGSISVATSEENITVVRWVDTNVVALVSTYAGVEPTDTCQRWDKKEKKYVEITRPFCVNIYNKFMGGVDLADRMVAHYPHSLKNKRFYLRIFFHFVNVALSNAWIVFRNKTGSKLPFVEFKASIAEAMIAVATKKKKMGRPVSSPTVQIDLKSRARPGVVVDVRFDGDGHYPEKTDTPNRCREKNCPRRSRYRCKKCAIHLCPECMEQFHTLED